MKNNAKETQPFIYLRATGQKVPVRRELHDAYYAGTARIRMEERSLGRCICPQHQVWLVTGTASPANTIAQASWSLWTCLSRQRTATPCWTWSRRRSRPSNVSLQTATCSTAFLPACESSTPMRTPSSPCGWPTTGSLTARSPRPLVALSILSQSKWRSIGRSSGASVVPSSQPADHRSASRVHPSPTMRFAVLILPYPSLGVDLGYSSAETP